MNTKLVESLTQIIFSLSKGRASTFERKIFLELSESSTHELIQMAQTGGALDFLKNEPELYTLAMEKQFSE